jgi:hypothetical protein
VSNWDNDGYFDDDAWFQAVTYDQTDYQDVDGYLEPAAVPSQTAAGLPAERLAEDPAGDRYAGYDEFGPLPSQPAPPPLSIPRQPPADEFGYLASQPTAPAPAPASPPWQQPPAEEFGSPAEEAWSPGAAPWQQPAAETWQQPAADEPWRQSAAAEPWQPAAAETWQQPAAGGEPWAPEIAPTMVDAWEPEAAPWEVLPPDEPGAPDRGEPYRDFAPRPVARRPGWLLLGISAVAAAAVGFSLVMLTHRGNLSLPSSALPPATASPRASGGVAPARPAATSSAPLTQAQAQQVLAAYTTANNTANAQANMTLLAGVEAGSSLAIDSGIYAAKTATHAAPYPAFGPAAASYYIPLEAPATYPHWFAVRVTNALLSGSAPSGKVINSEYLVFTQAAAGAPWLNSLEPFTLTSATTPSVALSASGYATAVAATGTPLALPAATASATTAASLDSGTGQPANPGNLADDNDLASFKKNLSPRPSITSRHSATTSPVFALRTTNGGALLFYDVAAQLTLTAAPGSTLHAGIPGFASTTSQSSELTLNYLDQFAVTDPPAASGTPAQVIADYSGLTGSAG